MVGPTPSHQSEHFSCLIAPLRDLPSSPLGFVAGAAEPGKLRAVKPDEEALLLRCYAGKAQAVCRAFHFPAKVAAAALAYLARFYLQYSVLDHHPRDIMLTAIYVACKVRAPLLQLPATSGAVQPRFVYRMRPEEWRFGLALQCVLFPPPLVRFAIAAPWNLCMSLCWYSGAPLSSCWPMPCSPAALETA